MMRLYPFFVTAFTLCQLLGADAASAPRIVDNLRKLPLAFEQNHGQAATAADFLARGAGYSVWLSHGNAHISLRRGKDAAPAAVDLRLVGARRNPKTTGRNTLPGKVNYFVGNDPSRWRTDVPTFGRVEYAEVYRGVDLAYYGNQGRLEYDFIVAPGADPSVIRLAAGGARKVQVDPDGDLLLDTAGGEVRFRRPVSYQEIAGTRHPVESRYVLAGSNEVRFTLGVYDTQYPLIIDPSLAYSTYLGGSADDYATAIAVGATGNAFVAGVTYSIDFPLANPEQADFGGFSTMFVSKLNAEGSGLVYSTYFGGSYRDSPSAIAVDSSGDAYLVGTTSSSNFPLKNPLYQYLTGYADAFVTRFNAAGSSLVYSTYLGGSSSDFAYGVAVDTDHNAYVAGWGDSTDFPITSGAYETSCSSGTECGFVTKINPAGSALIWSTYFDALVASIAVDPQGSVYLTGGTFGALPVTPDAPQPVYGGNEDGFVAKLNNAGASLIYCTYLGGSQWDSGYGIGVDSAGDAYIAGTTQSTDLAVTASALQPAPGGGYDAFVAKLNSTGTQWQYLTYLGGLRNDYATGIAVDSSGDAIVAGYTYSSNFPSFSAIQPFLPGNQIGVFKTTSAGGSWSASDTGIDDQTINAIAIDPASDADLLVGAAVGLFQSANGGTSWNINTGLELDPAFVAFSPSGGVAYAGGSDLVYSSPDAGTTWSFAGYLPCIGTNIAVDPTSPLVLYVGAGADPYCAAQSTDGGTTWTYLYALASAAPTAVYGFAVTSGSLSTVYAATGSGLFQSADAGVTWTAAGLQNLTVTAVLVDPITPATLYALVSGTVYKTTNGGESWAPSSIGMTATVNSLTIAPSEPSVLYAGTPTGVFLSKNHAASWSSAGLTQDQVTTLVIDPAFANKVYAVALVYTGAFVAKINPAGSKLVYSTFLSGTYADSAASVAVDSGGNAYIGGSTGSPDFPTTRGAFQPATGLSRYAGFVTKITQQTPACSYSVSPSALFAYPGGGPANFSVVSPTGCKWTPEPGVPWIAVASGTGPGVAPLAISVAANTGSARTGTITIGDTGIVITQAAGGCTYSLSAYSLQFPQQGGSQSVNVTAGEGCQWAVTGVPVGFTATAGSSGTGNGTVTLQAPPNPYDGYGPILPLTIDIANNSVAVNQDFSLAALPH